MRCTCASPTRRSASARHRRARATSTFPPSSAPPRSPAPTRSTRATASFRESDFARVVRAVRAALHRSESRGDAALGRQGPSARGGGQRFGLPLLPGSEALRDATARGSGGAARRFPGDDQGERRRRRSRHARRARVRRRGARVRSGHRRGDEQRSRTPRCISSGSSSARATSSSRRSPTTTDRCGRWGSASARCSAATRSWSRNRRAPR